MINAVFANQGLGQFGAALMLLIVTAAFKNSLATATTLTACSSTYACASAADKMWRIIIGVGAVPACVALYCTFRHQK
jgi:MFS transporter, PHS family, inorganic phosphate transporter